MPSDDENEDFLVIGYESRLFPQDPANTRSDQDLLIPWNDDESLLIDRFDCRLYLLDLSEKTIGKPGKSEETDNHDELEEEMCEQERYKDLEARIKQDEREEREEKRKRAEIAFNYDEEKIKSDDELEESDEEEANEAYQPPQGIKLPTGLELPETQRHGHLIERTAKFVVLNGPQMEVIIKAKHARDRTQNFDFLNFDNRLFSFYKFMCKLIREKKYLPAPPKRHPKPGEAFVPQKPENFVKDEEVSDSDSDGDYLHPLLSGAPLKKEPTEPIKLPPLPKSMSEMAKSNPYSSLYAIHSIQPQEPPEPPVEPTPSTSEGLVSYEESPTKPQCYETDPTEIHNYNTWHQNFYQRPTPFYPGPPLVPIQPEKEVVEQINLAARYVAVNGAYAERRLLDNRTPLSFLYPDNPNIIFYHTKIRYFQCKLNPYSAAFTKSKYFYMMEGNEAENNHQNGLTNSARIGGQHYDQPSTSVGYKILGNSNDLGGSGLNQKLESTVITVPSAPEPPKPQQFPGFEAVPDEADEKVKQLRKERARQFMADLLKRKRNKNEENRPVEKPEDVKESVREAFGEEEQITEYRERSDDEKKTEESIPPPEKVLPGLILNLVQKQVNKLVEKEENGEKEKRADDRAEKAEEVREEGVDQGQEEEGLEARRDEEDPEALQDREGSEVQAEVRKDEGEGREVGVQATEEDHQVQDIAPIDAATGPGPEVEKYYT
ncbi:unnamed protein product [Bursaphelenchus xylophilus]|uniref:(pine wood nematode) hypothetical protein n=1 Tax=Bursaphelenchus xylophilus TaxID=6326 RepID=A0A7I8X7F4_BURXY|nr:unnamed protein product [Bursaphelenchus xylophilus]CAG9126155.1 unnamed protein product [Bursaphelenchus xylophilus]